MEAAVKGATAYSKLFSRESAVSVAFFQSFADKLGFVLV